MNEASAVTGPAGDGTRERSAHTARATHQPAAPAIKSRRRSSPKAQASFGAADVEVRERSTEKASASNRPAAPANQSNPQRRSTAEAQSSKVSANVEARERSIINAQATTAPAAPAILPDRRFTDPLIERIVEAWRIRQTWHRQEKSLTLQMSAICRRIVGVKGKSDKAGLDKAKRLLKRIEEGTEADEPLAVRACLPLLEARRLLEPYREAIERELAKLAKSLPIAHVVDETYGLSWLTLAGIVGEAGDLSAYRTLRGLWKRMGVAVIEIEGRPSERQQRKKDATLALAHGYNPSRRAHLWNVGGGLIGAMGLGPRPRVGEDTAGRNDWSPWQKMFIDNLRKVVAQDETHRRPPVVRDGEMFESYSKHAAARAKRYVEKQFLKYLMSEWIKVSSAPRG